MSESRERDGFFGKYTEREKEGVRALFKTRLREKQKRISGTVRPGKAACSSG